MAPRIDRKNLNELKVRVGEPIRFAVDITGEPAPEVQWLLNDKEIGDTSHRTIENVPYHTKFAIRRANREDTGKYTIIATNSSGQDRAGVTVIILDKPGAPEGPLDISEIHKEGCKLSWKPPKDTGGMPLDGYVVEKMDTETGLWVPVSKTKEPQMEVLGLTPGHEYKFRVRALNKEGESEPLEAEKPIIAKNPFDPPGKPGDLKATDWDKDHVDLDWKAPEDDGGAPIEKYIVEKKDKFGDWEPCMEVPAEQLKASVEGLDANKPYEFRVRAVNKAGQSEPSNTSGQIITKPRKRKSIFVAIQE